MAQPDPRLLNPALLTLAGMRLRERQRQLRPAPCRPEPSAAWWAELTRFIEQSPWREMIWANVQGKPPLTGPNPTLMLPAAN